jgi:hypothetical protein
VRRSLVPVALAALFGAADQFLGARSYVVGAWAIDASLMSAPWLLIAFLAGWSQATVRRAALLGLVCTMVALLGYCAMTLSPVEGAHLTVAGARGLLLGQRRWAAGGLVTGPLFGWLGHRWRTRRDWKSVLVAGLVVCCEPFAHAATGTAAGFGGVWRVEVAAGLLMAVYASAVRARRGDLARVEPEPVHAPEVAGVLDLHAAIHDDVEPGVGGDRGALG